MLKELLENGFWLVIKFLSFIAKLAFGKPLLYFNPNFFSCLAIFLFFLKFYNRTFFFYDDLSRNHTSACLSYRDRGPRGGVGVSSVSFSRYPSVSFVCGTIPCLPPFSGCFCTFCKLHPSSGRLSFMPPTKSSVVDIFSMKRVFKNGC